MTEKKQQYLAFTLSRSLTPSGRSKALRYFGSVHKFFASTDSEQRGFVYRATGRSWEGKKKLFHLAEGVMEDCLRKEIDCLTIEDAEYPLRLRHIYDSPLVLFLRGDRTRLNPYLQSMARKNLAIVGTRKPEKYAADFAFHTGRLAGERGINVISGLALGIDSHAHFGSLKTGLTIAVLGSGVDRIYPGRHLRLARDIVNRGGLLISEYPPGAFPLKHHFPYRNRIISALSDGLLMVEAGKRSGALITVTWGLDHGKDIFVLDPGTMGEAYAGNRKLLSEGAIAVRHPREVLSHFQGTKPREEKRADAFSILSLLKNGPLSLAELADRLRQRSDEVLIQIMPHIITGQIVEAPGNQFYLDFDRAG